MWNWTMEVISWLEGVYTEQLITECCEDLYALENSAWYLWFFIIYSDVHTKYPPPSADLRKYFNK